jgi:hypothetical protein
MDNSNLGEQPYKPCKTCQTCGHSVPRVSIAVGFRPYCRLYKGYHMMPCIDWRAAAGGLS